MFLNFRYCIVCLLCMEQVYAMATRWGIVSAGHISHDFVTALATLSADEHTVVAVAARDLKRAQAFAELHKAQKAYASYEELANDTDIEVVYIGTVPGYHLEVAKLMLNAGKHVLCEKPFTMNLKQTTELVNLAKSKNLFLMEAIWSRSFPIYDWIKEEIDSGSLGEVKQVIASLGLPQPKKNITRTENVYGSATIEVGVYPIQFASFVFNGEKPTSIKASGHLDANGVENSASVTLLYKNGRTATILIHRVVQLPNEGIIVGTKGTLRVPNFWCPTQVFMPSGEVRSITLPESAIPFNYINSAALRFEGAEVRKCLEAGLKESPRVTLNETLLIAEIEDEIRRQIGVVYPQD